MNSVTLYTKPGCHLCEAVEQVIDRARKTEVLELVIRNILDDPADQARYANDIPVVSLNGREIARHRLGLDELLAALHRAQ